MTNEPTPKMTPAAAAEPNSPNLVLVRNEPLRTDLIVTWREAFPRPEWNDPNHWLAARPEAAR